MGKWHECIARENCGNSFGEQASIAILLFEADSNMFNRLLLSNRLMELAREHGVIPTEQYAERQSDGQDGAWLKRLFADVSRQLWLAMAIISADAETCYDRIAHVFASLVYQAVGVSISAISMVMLLSIQHMKFYLRTGLGESVGFMTAVIGSIIQGLCQGNTAAPAGWSHISAVLLRVYKRFGHGAKFTTAISCRSFDTAGVLYVDDVDLFVMNLSLVTEELWLEAARSTECWSELLTIPGGSGKGEKCFGYLIDYEWDDRGRWQYAPVPDMELEIILPDGSREGIALLPANAARVTLQITSSVANHGFYDQKRHVITFKCDVSRSSLRFFATLRRILRHVIHRMRHVIHRMRHVIHLI
jgi:hypothetical protein